MKFLKKHQASIRAAATPGMAGVASAAPAYLSNWFLDTDGPGGNAAYEVKDYLDLTGASFVHNFTARRGNSGTRLPASAEYQPAGTRLLTP